MILHFNFDISNAEFCSFLSHNSVYSTGGKTNGMVITRSLTKFFADLDDDAEYVERKVDLQVDDLQVGELEAKIFVHPGELKAGVRLDAILVQRRPCS